MGVGPDLAQPICMGQVRPTPKEEEERLHWAEIDPTIFRPGSEHPFSGPSSAQLFGPAQPIYFL